MELRTPRFVRVFGVPRSKWVLRRNKKNSTWRRCSGAKPLRRATRAAQTSSDLYSLSVWISVSRFSVVQLGHLKVIITIVLQVIRGRFVQFDAEWVPCSCPWWLSLSLSLSLSLLLSLSLFFLSRLLGGRVHAASRPRVVRILVPFFTFVWQNEEEDVCSASELVWERASYHLGTGI